MDAQERALLHETVLDALASTSGSPDEVDKVLTGLGWMEMLRDEPEESVAIVFRSLGTTNAMASVLDDVLASALGLEPSPEVAFLLPAFGTTAPSPRGLATSRVSRAKELVVVQSEGSAYTVRSVGIGAVTVETIQGIDPDARLHTVGVDLASGEATPLDGGQWDAAIAAGQVAIAHQVAGACRAMLDLARTHALERVQFDRPIARFQAVRHRLADTLVAIEALEAGLVSAHDEPGLMTAALAKALAGRAARVAASHCQQVLAGVGFTTDHPFHRFLKRNLVLDGLLGSTEHVTLDLGRQLLRTREVPRLVEL